MSRLLPSRIATSTARSARQRALGRQHRLRIDKDVIDKLVSQIIRLCYKNPMDIRNLLTYPNEDIISYILTIDEIIDGRLP